jgi:hypothetical protein
MPLCIGLGNMSSKILMLEDLSFIIDLSVGPPRRTSSFRTNGPESLKSMFIVPRTPSPTPIEARRPAELSHDEIAELQQQVAAQKASSTKIKLERDSDPRPRKKARAAPKTLELG